VSSQIIYLGSNPTTESGIYVAKYGYFILIPVDPARIEKICRDSQTDREKIDGLVKYVIPTLRQIWKKDKKIPVLQTELSQMNRK
jgi:hypothetical protein